MQLSFSEGRESLGGDIIEHNTERAMRKNKVSALRSAVTAQQWSQIKCYSGTLLNRHPLTVDTPDITDNSESLDCFSIDFSTLETSQ